MVFQPLFLERDFLITWLCSSLFLFLCFLVVLSDKCRFLAGVPMAVCFTGFLPGIHADTKSRIKCCRTWQNLTSRPLPAMVWHFGSLLGECAWALEGRVSRVAHPFHTVLFASRLSSPFSGTRQPGFCEQVLPRISCRGAWKGGGSHHCKNLENPDTFLAVPPRCTARLPRPHSELRARRLAWSAFS